MVNCCHLLLKINLIQCKTVVGCRLLSWVVVKRLFWMEVFFGGSVGNMAMSRQTHHWRFCPCDRFDILAEDLLVCAKYLQPDKSLKLQSPPGSKPVCVRVCARVLVCVPACVCVRARSRCPWPCKAGWPFSLACPLSLSLYVPVF